MRNVSSSSTRAKTMEALTCLSSKVLTKNNNRIQPTSRLAQPGRYDFCYFPSPHPKKDHLILFLRRDASLVSRSHAPSDAEGLTGFETAASLSQKTKLLKTVHVEFRLQKECMFGEQFLLVGEDPMIGLWDPSNAIPLNWSEGHTWSVELDVRTDLTMQYKFILKLSTGEIIWQPGPDRIFKTWESNNTIVIMEDWENAGAQQITEEQIFSSPDLEPVVAGNFSYQVEEVIPDGKKDVMLSGRIGYAEDKSNGKFEVVNGIVCPVEGHMINANIKLEPEESVSNRNEVPADNNNFTTLTSKNPVTMKDEETFFTCEQGAVLVPGLNPSTSSLRN